MLHVIFMTLLSQKHFIGTEINIYATKSLMKQKHTCIKNYLILVFFSVPIIQLRQFYSVFFFYMQFFSLTEVFSFNALQCWV